MPARTKTRPAANYDLFAPLSPYSSGYLAVDDIHQIYWEQCGNPDGYPIVFLHGGPGGGISPFQRRFFDPNYYRIILFDQRGSGKSNPHACIINNTTEHLIEDIEKLRTHLSIQSWHVFGGSWGSTLALSYASRYPERILSMTLRGIFLMSQHEINWFLYGIKKIFPEAWEQFVNPIPENERHDLLSAYYKRLTSDDLNVAMDAAISWALYESACSSLIPNYETITTDEQKAKALCISRIEAHFFTHEKFTGEKDILNNINRFRHIPTTIIQGRYDIICPIETAYKLHQMWPEAEYIVVPDGGHSSQDPSIRSRLIEATEHVKTLL